MKIVTTIFSVGLFCLFVVGATFNARCWIKGGKSEPHSSIAPLIAGVAGCLGLLLFPYQHWAGYAWLPLLIDVGCLPYLVGVSIYLTHDWWITNPRFTVQTLEHKSPDVHLIVTLFRTGQVRMIKTNLAPRDAITTKPRWLSISNGGKWRNEDGTLILDSHQGKIVYRRVEMDEYIWVSSDQPNAFDRLDLESARS